MFLKAAEPVSNTWHLSGPRLLDGKEAVDEARHRSMTPKEAEADPFALSLHPDLLLSKKHWARHVLITGSVEGRKAIPLRHQRRLHVDSQKAHHRVPF
ncbi:hypothetical protein G6F22_019720 [Rhizopus arrhizus]|nr:hypothetical protein G6F22_019720 [Rhizopus arrhizus]